MTDLLDDTRAIADEADVGGDIGLEQVRPTELLTKPREYIKRREVGRERDPRVVDRAAENRRR